MCKQGSPLVSSKHIDMKYRGALIGAPFFVLVLPPTQKKVGGKVFALGLNS